MMTHELIAPHIILMHDNTNKLHVSDQPGHPEFLLNAHRNITNRMRIEIG